MSKAADTKQEINKITAKLIEVGLSDDQNFAILRDIGEDRREVTLDLSSNFTLVLRNTPYPDIYREIKRARDYNVSLPDGALIQLQYIFQSEEVVRHRLAFFPSPDLTEYQNEPEVYELDLMYAEILERRVVTTPIRFDFDADKFVENDHPMAHLSIGLYKNCRIPMRSAISPYRFFEFILGSFYNTAYRNYRAELVGLGVMHPSTITENESKRVHISLECR